MKKRTYNSGLSLVKRPKPPKRGKFVSIKQAAAMEFEPWRNAPDYAVSAEFFDGLAINSRIAFKIMHRTKDELVQSQIRLGLAKTDMLMSDLADAAEKMKTIVQMLEAAHGRLLCASAAAERADAA